MATKIHAVVSRAGYTYRGQSIPKGRVVLLDQKHFDNAQRTQPSYFREAKDAEVKAAGTIVDLSSVQSKTAQNVADAEAALEADAPKPKRS